MPAAHGRPGAFLSHLPAAQARPVAQSASPAQVVLQVAPPQTYGGTAGRCAGGEAGAASVAGAGRGVHAGRATGRLAGRPRRVPRTGAGPVAATAGLAGGGAGVVALVEGVLSRRHGPAHAGARGQRTRLALAGARGGAADTLGAMAGDALAGGGAGGADLLGPLTGAAATLLSRRLAIGGGGADGHAAVLWRRADSRSARDRAGLLAAPLAITGARRAQRRSAAGGVGAGAARDLESAAALAVAGAVLPARLALRCGALDVWIVAGEDRRAGAGDAGDVARHAQGRAPGRAADPIGAHGRAAFAVPGARGAVRAGTDLGRSAVVVDRWTVGWRVARRVVSAGPAVATELRRRRQVDAGRRCEAEQRHERVSMHVSGSIDGSDPTLNRRPTSQPSAERPARPAPARSGPAPPRSSRPGGDPSSRAGTAPGAASAAHR